MNSKDAFKPGVNKSLLLFVAGLVWIGVGVTLVTVAYSWLAETPKPQFFLFWGLGMMAALAVHHFKFLKIVDKNIQRIQPMTDKRCLFGFISWKSYLLIMVMVALGVCLRHSAIPRPYLAILYSGIGVGLILSSLRYIRVFISHLRK